MNETTKQHALRILERRDVSRKMLMDRLTQKGAEVEDAREVADWLCSLGVVNDERFAVLVVRHYVAKGYGIRRVQDELYRRGIPKEFWDNALTEISETEITVDRLLRAKLKGVQPGRSELKKACDGLIRRGFSWEEVRGAVERLQVDTEDENDG